MFLHRVIWFITEFRSNAVPAYSGWLHLVRGPRALNSGTSIREHYVIPKRL